MLVAAIDAVILIILLQTINDEQDIGFGTAFIVALVAAIVTGVAVAVAAAVLGLAGLFVGAVIGAIVVTVGVSAIFGVEIKRSFLIGGLFVVAHIGVSMVFNMLFSV